MATNLKLPGVVNDLEQGIFDVGSGGVGVTTNAEANEPIASGVSKAESAATAVPDFLSRLTSANTWLRVAEVGLGILLILVGLDKLGNLDVAGKIATAGKAAALA